MMIDLKLNIPVNGNWTITRFELANTHTFLGRLTFSGSDSPDPTTGKVTARIDIGKMAIIDTVPEGLQGVNHEFLMEHVLSPISEALQKALTEEWNSKGTES